MREIKFRFFTPDTRMIEDHDGWVEGIGINEALNCSKEYGYKVMQFTGLRDKHGKEIYEGDVCKFWDSETYMGRGAEHTRDVEIIRVMEWYEESACFRMDYSAKRKIHTTDIEVIGNIYEHPNLLK